MKTFRTAAVLLAAMPVWGAADPQLLGLLMPDAKMIAGAHVGQAKASPFGRFVLSQAGAGTEFDQLKAATGFDPRTDLTELVGAASGPDGQGLVAGKGAFEPNRITNFAMTQGAKIESYRGYNLIHSGGQETAAFLDGSTVVFGHQDLVKAAVDRWVGGRSSSALSARATEVSASSQAWAVATGLSQMLGSSSNTAPPEAQMVQNVLSKISQVSGGVNLGESITLHGQALTGSAQDAQALADVFRFVMSMAAPKSPLPVMPEVSASGTAVNFTMMLSEQQAEQIFKPRN